MRSNKYTEGVWAGVGRTESGGPSGESYHDWKFYDDTYLDQAGCYEHECSSGKGNYSDYITISSMKTSLILLFLHFTNTFR